MKKREKSYCQINKKGDQMILVLIIIFAIVVANVFLAGKMAEVAIMKGYGDEIHAWAWCFWLGIIGYIYVLSLPDKVAEEQNQKIMALCQAWG